MTLAVGMAVLGWMAVWEAERITAARRTVTGGWAAGLAAGVVGSLMLTALLVVALRMNKRTSGRALGAVSVLTLVITVSVLVAFSATAPPRVNVNHVPYVVTTAIAVAGMAYAATFAVLCLALTVWAARVMVRRHRADGHVTIPEHADHDLLTALIGPRRSGWDVTWVGDGRLPRHLAAATLTEAADQAAAAVVRHYLRHPASAVAAEFQIALYPHPYTNGPIFEISGGSGMFIADATESSTVLQGATLEDLVTAAESASDLRPGNYMFRWLRPVSALSPLPPRSGSLPATDSDPP